MSAVRSRMVHRATVERDTGGGTDEWGQEVAPAWTTLHSALPCFWWTEITRATDVEQTATYTAVVEDLRMIAPLGTDLTEADHIVAITDRAGNSVVSGPLGIESVTRHHTHLEAALVAVGG